MTSWEADSCLLASLQPKDAYVWSINGSELNTTILCYRDSGIINFHHASSPNNQALVLLPRYIPVIGPADSLAVGSVSVSDSIELEESKANLGVCEPVQSLKDVSVTGMLTLFWGMIIFSLFDCWAFTIVHVDSDLLYIDMVNGQYLTIYSNIPAKWAQLGGPKPGWAVRREYGWIKYYSEGRWDGGDFLLGSFSLLLSSSPCNLSYYQQLFYYIA